MAESSTWQPFINVPLIYLLSAYFVLPSERKSGLHCSGVDVTDVGQASLGDVFRWRFLPAS